MLLSETAAALLYAAAVLLAGIFILVRARPDADYIRVCILFIFLFFMAPALMTLNNDTIFYAGKHFQHDNERWMRVAASIWFFLFGFFCKDFLLANGKFSTKASALETSPKTQINLKLSKSRGYFLTFSALLLVLISIALSPSIEEQYLQRSGQAQGSQTLLLLGIVSSSLLFGAVFVLLATKQNTSAILLLVFYVFLLMLSATGRFNILVAVFLLFTVLFKVSTAKIVRVFPIAFAILLPALTNGKEIIYSIVAQNEAPSINLLIYSDIFSEVFFRHFAHPFMSLYVVDELIETTGPRLFFDLVQGVLFYFRFFGIDFGDSLTYFNTEVFLGKRESIIPPGYLAFGFTQAAYPGVLVMGILYRSLFNLIWNNSTFSEFRTQPFRIYTILICANTFYHGELRLIVLSYFLNFLLIYLAFNFCQKKPYSAKRPSSSQP